VRKVWPSTLAGQLALLVALALFIAQGIHAFLLVEEREERRLEAISAPSVARIVDVADRLRADSALVHRRDGFIGRARVTPDSSVPEHIRRFRRAERRIFEELRENAQDIDDIRVAPARREDARPWMPGFLRDRPARDPHVLLVSAHMTGGPWINLVAPVPPVSEGILARILIQTGILYAVILLALLWLVRRSSASLARLTRAADAFGHGRDEGAITESGPEDIRHLIRAFNGMRERISAMLTEKDRMIGAISHDLRTPLASLRLRAENVEEEGERNAMIASIADLEDTLSDILMLARLRQSGEEVRAVDLLALVDAVVEDFRELGADVELLTDGRVTAHIRSNLTRRALRNVIDNAIKYGTRARVRVEHDGSDARIEVEDDGPGIPEEALERVFGDFERLENSRNRGTGGSGLGLTLAREILRAQGGTIELENRDEGGLRVLIRLPLGGAKPG